MDMKKFLALITAFILVVSLVGCSQNQTNPSDNNKRIIAMKPIMVIKRRIIKMKMIMKTKSRQRKP